MFDKFLCLSFLICKKWAQPVVSLHRVLGAYMGLVHGSDGNGRSAPLKQTHQGLQNLRLQGREMLWEDGWAWSFCVTVPAGNWASQSMWCRTGGGCSVSSPSPGAHPSHVALTCDLVVMLGGGICLGSLVGTRESQSWGCPVTSVSPPGWPRFPPCVTRKAQTC